jgi:hypothetical protein
MNTCVRKDPTLLKCDLALRFVAGLAAAISLTLGTSSAQQIIFAPRPVPVVNEISDTTPRPIQPESPAAPRTPPTGTVAESPTTNAVLSRMETAPPGANPEAPTGRTDNGSASGETDAGALSAAGGLESLYLTSDNPRLEISESSSIPLFFTILGTYMGTNDVVVRARFISGSATPGEDFDLSQPVKLVPAVGGLGSLGWLPIPTIPDEVNEGNETALFELSIDGSTNAPIRIAVTLLEDMNPGQVGFVSTRFQINEGSTNGYAQIRLWRTLNTRQTATVTYRLEGPASAIAVLGGQTRRTATFNPGDSQIFVRIPLVNDTEVQGTQDVRLTLEPNDGTVLMEAFGSSVLTVADDETPGVGAPLSISEYETGDGRRGVAVSTTVPRGYQVRLEYSENGIAGPWQPSWILEGADVERFAFDSYDSSTMRMYRILSPEPLDFTFPW